MPPNQSATPSLDVVVPVDDEAGSADLSAVDRSRSLSSSSIQQQGDLVFSGIGFDVAVAVPSAKHEKKKKKKKKEKATKQILDGISVRASQGRLLAVMGPSGAGKTSFLNIAAGRQQPSCGTTTLAGVALSATQIKTRSSFVQQDDCILPSMTPREAISMAALLQLPRRLSSEQKLAKAEEVISLLQLEGCADTPIGSPVEGQVGVSGGERKRVAIGMSLVVDPYCVFLDEPTSGLDSFKAFSVVKSLRNLARESNRIVVCTIHQPSSDIFNLFDDLLLLNSGRTAYFGPATDSLQHFADHGFPCPRFSNPADFFFMHVLTAGQGESDGGEQKDGGTGAALAKSAGQQAERNEFLSAAWRDSDRCALLEAECLACESSAGVDEEEASSPLKKAAPAASFLTQFAVLSARSARELRRNKLKLRGQIAQSVAFAVIMSLIYMDIGSDQQSIQDRNSILFFACANGMMTSVMGVLSTYSDERSCFIREHEGGMYGVPAYFTSKLLMEVPGKIVKPCVFMSIIYWSAGLQAETDKFGVAIVISVLQEFMGGAIGLSLASVVANIQIALMVAPLLIMPLMMFSGFFINADSIPVYFQWIQYISPMKYSYSALVQNEFNGLDLHCEADQWLATADGTLVCRYEEGEDFLKTLNIESQFNIANCALLLFALCVAFNLLAFLGLRRLTNKTVGVRPAAVIKESVKASDTGGDSRV